MIGAIAGVAVRWVVVIGCVSGLAAQPAKDRDSRRNHIPPNAQKLIDLASSVPPELRADTLLRILEAGFVRDRATKIQLAEEAFHTARDARHPVRLVLASGFNVDSEQGFLGEAMSGGLDTVSLQSRAVDLMLPVDITVATRLFQSIARHELPSRKCDDFLIYDFRAYFQTAERLIKRLIEISPRERRADYVTLTTETMGRVVTHSHLVPAIRFLTNFSGPADVRVMALSQLTDAMARIPSEDRSFSEALHEVPRSLAPLIGRLEAERIGSQELVAEVRRYVVSNLTAPRCADNWRFHVKSIPEVTFRTLLNSDARVPEYLEPYNRLFESNNLAVLKQSEMAPSKVVDFAKSKWHWQSKTGKRVMTALKSLDHGPNAALKGSKEWRGEVRELIGELFGWQPAEEQTAADYFIQRAFAYVSILRQAPSDIEEFDIALRDFVVFLNAAEDKNLDAVLWIWHIRRLVENERAGDPAKRARVVGALVQSGSAVMQIFASLPEASGGTTAGLN